jgi:hypothetical protein
MKSAARWIVWTLVVLFAIPSMTFPQNRWDPWGHNGGYGRYETRESVYRDAYNIGYRDGMRQGNYDLRIRRHPNYRTPEYNHPDQYRGNYESRHRGDYKKGYQSGYRDGYNQAFRGIHGGRWPM